MSHETGAQSHNVGLVRSLGLFDITMIGVGAMIGAGIFVLTGIAAGQAGPALIVAFALNGVITVFTAMVYAELGSAIPEAGGGYLWVKEGLPGPNAFLSGWMSWFAHAVAGSLYGVGFGGFTYELMRIFFLDEPEAPGNILLNNPISLPFGIELGEAALVQKGFAVLVILLFLYINYRGSSETGLAGNIVTVLKIVVIGIFIVSGLVVIFGDASTLDKFKNFSPDGIIGIASAMGLTFIAFEGYEIIVQAGEEVRDPRKNIPRAIFLSLAIVIPIYILVAFVIIGAVEAPPGQEIHEWLGELKEVGIARAASQFMPFGTFLILIGGLLSTMSALNATTFSSTRVSFAMGRDKSLPDGFSRIHPQTHTPHFALIWTGGLILFMAIALPIEDVAASADIMFLLLFLQVNVAVITLRSKYGKDLSYGYLMPFFPIVPIASIIMLLVLALSLFEVSLIAWGFAVVWMGAGFALYYSYARPRQQKFSRSPVVQQLELTAPEDTAPYRVLVSVANPESLDSLITPAIRAARTHNGKITLLHIIAVPLPTPLSSGYEYVQSGEALRAKALQMVEDAGVPVEYIIRVARRVAPAIVDTARERRADLVIMGWRGGSQHANVVLGSNIDQILNQVNCDLMMLQPGPVETSRILIPIADPRQITFALRTVQLYASGEGTQLDVLHIFTPGTPQAERDRFTRTLERRIESISLINGRVNVRSMDSGDRLGAIVEESKGYDYLVLGATRDSWIKQRFFGNTPVRIAQSTDTPVLLVRPEGHPVQFGIMQVLNYVRGGYAQVEPESRQRLEDHGFLESEESGASSDKLETALNETAVLIVGVLTIIAAILMYAGGGGTLTWIGTVAYLVLLLGFTWISTSAPPAQPAHSGD